MHLYTMISVIYVLCSYPACNFMLHVMEQQTFNLYTSQLTEGSTEKGKQSPLSAENGVLNFLPFKWHIIQYRKM